MRTTSESGNPPPTLTRTEKENPQLTTTPPNQHRPKRRLNRWYPGPNRGCRRCASGLETLCHDPPPDTPDEVLPGDILGHIPRHHLRG